MTRWKPGRQKEAAAPKPAPKPAQLSPEQQRRLEHVRAVLSPEQIDQLSPETLRAYLNEPEPEVHTHTETGDPIEERLRKLDPARQQDRVKQARAEHAAAAAALEQHDERRRDIRDTVDDAKAKVASLREKTKDDSARALLAGKSAPDNSAARKRIERETEKIEAGQSALELAEPQRAGLEAAERAAFADLCDQVLDLTGAQALADLGRARKALAAMAPTLASLIAGDILRERLIGTRWSFDTSHVRPLSGEMLARAFVNSVPEKLKTEELTEAALRTAAERLAVKTLAEIQKKETEQCD